MTRALPLLALLAACCTTSSATVWRGQGLEVRADAGVQERWRVDVLAVTLAKLDEATAWGEAQFPAKAGEIRALRGKFVLIAHSEQSDLGGYAAGQYDGDGVAQAIWLASEPLERLGNLLAHEFCHAVMTVAYGHPDAAHALTAKHGCRW